MAQMSDRAVKRALEEAGTSTGQDGLRPEMLERINAAYADPDPDRRLARARALLDELSSQAESNARQLEREREDFGLGPDQARQFLKGDALSDEARALVEGEMASFVESAAADARRVAQDGNVRKTTAARGMRANRLRI